LTIPADPDPLHPSSQVARKGCSDAGFLLRRGPKGDADDTDTLVRKLIAQERKSAGDTGCLACTKCDALAKTLTVCREIHEKDGVPLGLQETGTAKHLSAVGSHTMQKENGSATRRTAGQPTDNGLR
jgi:hypothetical protein